MAGSLNRVMLIGNCGKDPEVRSSAAGEKIVNITLATGESWTDRATGERKERTEWHRIVVFNDRIADVAEKYVRKGSKIYVEGALQTRKWTDQSGQDRYQTEVVISKFRGELTLLDSRNGGGQTDAAAAREAPARSTPARVAPSRDKVVPAGAGTDLEDEIPF